MVRAIGGICAIILAALFAYTLYLSFSTEQLVVPTNGVIAGASVDDPAEGAESEGLLSRRTELQRWREVSGPSPSAENPPETALAVPGDPDTPPDNADVAAPEGVELAQTWLTQAPEDLLREPEFVEGVTSLPQPIRGVFVQPDGRVWRSAHNGPIAFGGGLYLFGVAALLAIFLTWRGRIPLKEGFSGSKVPRLNAFERANHWMTAGSFIIMALTGIVILYGKSIIRPWLGADLFGDLASASAWTHMAMILPFSLGLLAMIVMWTLQNIPKKLDWHWLRRGGGFLSDDQPSPPAEKFNAGQKLIFWSVILGGLALIASGLTLMFPFLWAGYDGMQITQGLHAVIGLIMIGIIFGHIYIGTIGMVGAFDAMWSGLVDRNWAHEHHSIWYRRVFGGDRPEHREPAE
jgi:formate dehydrogenase subunit gamma